MNPEEFIQNYEQALSSQDWSRVAPLVHEDACVIFSNGAVHRGKGEVGRAFEKNFSSIKDETYSITNVSWLLRTNDVAVYLFDFNWTGIIDGRPASGAGCGTSLLVNENGLWQLLVEHLGPRAV